MIVIEHEQNNASYPIGIATSREKADDMITAYIAAHQQTEPGYRKPIHEFIFLLSEFDADVTPRPQGLRPERVCIDIPNTPLA
jgi:hypothetical protein